MATVLDQEYLLGIDALVGLFREEYTMKTIGIHAVFVAIVAIGFADDIYQMVVHWAVGAVVIHIGIDVAGDVVCRREPLPVVEIPGKSTIVQLRPCMIQVHHAVYLLFGIIAHRSHIEVDVFASPAAMIRQSQIQQAADEITAWEFGPAVEADETWFFGARCQATVVVIGAYQEVRQMV